jgi:hypothetical protein
MYCVGSEVRTEFICYVEESRPLLWSSGQSSWLQIQRSGLDSRRYQIFWEVVDLERCPLSLVSTTEELLERKSSGSGLENREYIHTHPHTHTYLHTHIHTPTYTYIHTYTYLHTHTYTGLYPGWSQPHATSGLRFSQRWPPQFTDLSEGHLVSIFRSQTTQSKRPTRTEYAFLCLLLASFNIRPEDGSITFLRKSNFLNTSNDTS